MLSGTMKNLGKLMNTGGQRYMCYLIAFIVAVFFLLYLMLKWRA